MADVKISQLPAATVVNTPDLMTIVQGGVNKKITWANVEASLENTVINGKLLTGYVSAPGVITATDSILSAIQKLNGNAGSFLSTSLANAHIFVGNGSNLATDVAVSGDLSLVNTGAFTVNSVGGSSATNINTATIAANAATSLNIPNTIIKRDGAGQFASSTIKIDVAAPAGLENSSSTLIVDVFQAQLNDLTGLLSIDLDNREAPSASGANSLNWESRRLFASNSSLSVDWESRALSDGVNGDALRWGNGSRALVDENGAIQLTWSPAGIEAGIGAEFVIDPNGNLTKINNVPYSWPAIQGAASTTLLNDGSGNLSWVPILSDFLTDSHIFVGNASNLPIDVAVSGDLSLANTGAFTIVNSAVTNAKLANMANQTIKGNISGGAAAPSDLSLAVGTTGTDFNIAYAGSTITFDLPTASAVNRGALSSADWTTFNNKQPAGNYITALIGDVTATGPGSVTATLATVNGNVGSFGSSTAIPSFTVNAKGLITAVSTNVVIAPAGTLTGTTLASNVITSSLTTVGLTTAGIVRSTAVGLLSSAELSGDATTSGSNAITLATVNANVGSFTNATITVNAKGLITAASSGTSPVLTVTASAPLASSGGSTPNISITQSNTTTDGYLSATDWNTFNNKQPAGNYITGLTGDVTAAGPGNVAATLATVNANVGTFGSSTSIPTFTVNAKGLITAASGNVVIAPAGTLTGTTLASNVITSSLTTVGTIGTGTWQGSVIGIAYGGTNNSTPYTPGSVIFSNGTSLTQDNANFYWDDTNLALGIGVIPATTAVVDVVNNSGSAKAIQTTGYGGNVGFRARYANGTLASPTAAVNGNILSFFSGRGYGTSQFAVASTGAINIIAAETFTNTSNATYIAFNTTPTGSVTSAETMRIASTGVTIDPSSTSALVINTTSLIFDSTNNALGIGIQPSTATAIDIINSSATSKPVQITSYGTGSTNVFRGRFARGTSGSPTAAQTSDLLSVFSGRGYGASQFAAASTGVINVVAGENFTNTSNLTYLQFLTTPTGSVTAAESMRIASTGVTLGPQSSSTALHQTNGGMQVTTRTITANLTIDTTTTDYIIYCNHSAAISITFPAPTNGRLLVIKDISGAAQTNNITMVRHASEKIEGLAASKLLETNWGSWTFSSDGTDWYMV